MRWGDAAQNSFRPKNSRLERHTQAAPGALFYPAFGLFGNLEIPKWSTAYAGIKSLEKATRPGGSARPCSGLRRDQHAQRRSNHIMCNWAIMTNRRKRIGRVLGIPCQFIWPPLPALAPVISGGVPSAGLQLEMEAPALPQVP
jgi:hypothetical protein